MSAKHTPFTSDELDFIYDADGRTIADVLYPEYVPLLTAAPDLLEALTLLLRECEESWATEPTDYGWPAALAKARAAIAKATGGAA